MKKILAFLLAATLLSAMFVIPSAAADNVNYQITVESTKKAPNVTDGVVKTGEYGTTPVHRYSESKAQFTHGDDHDEYDNWDFEFYMTWDENNLYMAWVVESEIHHGLEEGTYDPKTSEKVSDEWPAEGYQSMLGNMWWNSCVQFILTPGAPQDGVTTYKGATDAENDFLEVGLALLGDGTQARTIWFRPQGVSEDDIKVNEWDAAIVRNEANKTTTYEVAIPWKYTTVNAMGDNAQFGLTYAVAAQENYNEKKGMIEWQDGILGDKQPDKAAVVTLKSDDIGQVIINPVVNGELPEEAKEAIQFMVKDFNKAIGAEGTTFITDLSKDLNADYGLQYSYGMLLKPVEGEADTYELVEAVQANGEMKFETELADGMLIAAAHTDGSAGASGANRVAQLKTIGVGSKLVLFGIDVKENKCAYDNSMIYVKELVEADGGEEDESSEASSEVESSEASSEVESSEASEESSKAASSVATSSEAEDEGGLGAWLWVIIGVAVAAVAAVVVIVLKKKKA